MILKKIIFWTLGMLKIGLSLWLLEVINMYLLPIISCIIQQTGYENIQTY